MRKLQGQIQTREALAKRAPRLEDAGPEVISEKQQRKRDAKIEERRKSMAAAGLDYDHRTAAGRRHVDLANMGKNLRASINHMNSCLRKKSERTDARVVAWSMFDRHCHKVNAGLIASPRYEPGVDTSTIPGVSDSRLDALKADAELREFLGRDMHGLLVEVVYHQRAFRDLQGLSYLDSHEIYILFKRALDLTAAMVQGRRGQQLWTRGEQRPRPSRGIEGATWGRDVTLVPSLDPRCHRRSGHPPGIPARTDPSWRR